jgi:hypothetical protein
VALLGCLAADTRAGALPPSLGWAGLLDEESLTCFLVELAHANDDVRRFQQGQGRRVLEAIERTCSTWQAIAVTEHAQATAPGPDAKEPETTDGFAAYCDAIREHDLTSADGALVEARRPGPVARSMPRSTCRWPPGSNSTGGSARRSSGSSATTSPSASSDPRLRRAARAVTSGGAHAANVPNPGDQQCRTPQHRSATGETS